MESINEGRHLAELELPVKTAERVHLQVGNLKASTGLIGLVGELGGNLQNVCLIGEGYVLGREGLALPRNDDGLLTEGLEETVVVTLGIAYKLLYHGFNERGGVIARLDYLWLGDWGALLSVEGNIQIL